MPVFRLASLKTIKLLLSFLMKRLNVLCQNPWYRSETFQVRFDIHPSLRIERLWFFCSQSKHSSLSTQLTTFSLNTRFTSFYFFFTRAIYRWTAATGGVKQCFENNPSANTAEEYVTKFQLGRVSHAQILQLLCM